MARIRTIKPDFWDSEDTVAADLRTRLLYIAMWNWADDYGIGDGTPVRIIGFAFPQDNIPASDYPRLLADVSRAFNVVFFEFSGRRYYAIPAWEEHQRTEKKAKPKAGLLEAAKAAIAAAQTHDAESPTNAAESPTLSDGSPDAGSWKSEREREELKDLPDPDGSSDPLDHITESDFPGTFDPIPTGYTADFEKWWDCYPLKTGKRKAFAAWKSARKRATDEQLIDGARRYNADPNRHPKYTKHADGWLNRDGWLDEDLPGDKAVGGIEW